MAKIVIADSDFAVSDIEQKMIEDAGIEFARFQDKSAAGIVKNCADAEGIITGYGEFPREVFAALPKLEVVSRSGVGYDTVDLAAATEFGVAVCNVPGYATEVVSDHAIAMTLALLRRLPELNADVHHGIWDPTGHRPMGQVYARSAWWAWVTSDGRWRGRRGAWGSRSSAGHIRWFQGDERPKDSRSFRTMNC